MAALKGTETSDKINGSEFSDLIQGLNGDDWLTGGLGRDSIFGGDGDDVIYAGENNVFDGIATDDTETNVLASEYDNFLNGEDGNDLLIGSILDDLEIGGDGDDYLRGYEGDDNLLGGAGNDEIRGDLGEDILLGGSGDDLLHGHYGDDFISGGSGKDRLYGFNDHRDPSRSNIDILTGGSGEDKFLLGSHYETYYQLSQDNDLGVITDLNTAEDVIQLHRQSSDYSLVVGTMEAGGTAGTYIYYNVYSDDEAIAFVTEQTELDLTADYFDFV